MTVQTSHTDHRHLTLVPELVGAATRLGHLEHTAATGTPVSVPIPEDMLEQLAELDADHATACDVYELADADLEQARKDLTEAACRGRRGGHRIRVAVHRSDRCSRRRHDQRLDAGRHVQSAREAARMQLLTLGAGIFAAGALMFTGLNFVLARRQAHDTAEAERRTIELTEQGQVTDRYTKAIEQLGSDKRTRSEGQAVVIVAR